MTNTTVGREPLQIFEIEQPSCSNEYGVAPCSAAGADKCFNTRATCQDSANYNQDDTIFWRFTHASEDRLEEIPSLTNVTTAATVLNAGGSSDDISVLGTRSSITVSLIDHVYDDSKADKYLTSRSYNPLTQGTFWGKFRARNPYISNSVCRVYNGYRGQSLVEMTQKTYLIDKVNPPNSNGVVTIGARDPLKLAGDKLAKIPSVSSIQLLNAINDTQNTGVILIGSLPDIDAQLGNTGTTRYISFGDELMSYTGYTTSGTQYTLAGVTRGVLNTTAESHDAGDAGQRAVRYELLESWKIARDAILNYSSVPADYIDSAAWDTEGDTWLAPYTFTGTITEPTAVVDIVGELAEQSLFYIWWNENTQLIELRALSPVNESGARVVTDEDNILSGTVQLAEKPAQRISRVAVYFNQRNPLSNADDITNYSNVRLDVDGGVESEFFYNESVTKTIFSRWIVTESQALQVSYRLLAAFRDTPKYMTFSVDAKDNDINVSDVVNVFVDQLQNQFGVSENALFQVISLNESQYSHKIDLQLREFTFQIERAAFWTDAAQVVYTLASDSDKLFGNGWWSDDDGLMSNGDDGYKWS